MWHADVGSQTQICILSKLAHGEFNNTKPQNHAEVCHIPRSGYVLRDVPVGARGEVVPRPLQL